MAKLASAQHLSVVSESWRTRLWPLPVAAVVAAAALGIALPRLDGEVADELSPGVTAYLFTGGPEAARSVLSVIAGSLMTVTSLTFSLTIVTLQLASSQFSPRVLRTFTRDRLVHVSLALLLGTFVYAVTVLRTVRASLAEQVAFVPQISVTVAYLFALASVIIVVVFLAHLARQIRVESMMRDVHAETDATVTRVLTQTSSAGTPTAVPTPPGTATLVRAGRSGFLTFTDDQDILEATAEADATAIIDRCPGDSLVAGTPIGRVWRRDGTALSGPDADELTNRLSAAVHTGYERTAAQDAAFGFRQLIDVAARALSPGINDPTTAVHVLGHASALLCRLVTQQLGHRIMTDDAGHVRVVLHRPDFGALLHLVISAPSRYGAGDPDVMARLLLLLREVAWHCDDDQRRHEIGAELQHLRDVVDRQEYPSADREMLIAAAAAADRALAGNWYSG
jgi:uncharacterized membrane protein